MRAWSPSLCGIRALRTPCTRHCSSSRTRGRQDNPDVAKLLKRDEAVDNITVNGWIKSVRKQKRVAFAAIGDGSTVASLQAVLKPGDAAELSYGTAVKLQGDWTKSQGAEQSFELQAKRVCIEGENDAESNHLQPKFHTAEYLRTIPHLRPRVPTNALLLRLRSQVIASLTRFFNDEGFVQAHTPIITSSDCEGAGEVFTVSSNSAKDSMQKLKSENEAHVEHFFRDPKYLTVSAQLHLEALAQAVKKVWTLSPTFRAEKSDTSRHLAEFYMLEAEVCFANDVEDVLDLVEGMLRTVAIDLKQSQIGAELLQVRQTPVEQAGDDGNLTTSAKELQKRWDGLASSQWRRITYEAAVQQLKSSGFDVAYHEGLSAEHERALASMDEQRRPLFIVDYPRDQKPFYMMPSRGASSSNDSAKTVACFDLLVPDLCELAGGSMREHRSKELLEAMQSKGVEGRNLEWYQDLRRFGSVPHGGFGVGFDRLLCYLSGVSNIRDIVAFPRWYGRCDC